MTVIDLERPRADRSPEPRPRRAARRRAELQRAERLQRAAAEYHHLCHVLAPELRPGPHYVLALDQALARARALLEHHEPVGATGQLAVARCLAARYGAEVPDPLPRRRVPAELVRPGDLVIGWQHQPGGRPEEVACEVATVAPLGQEVCLVFPASVGHPCPLVGRHQLIPLYDEGR